MDLKQLTALVTVGEVGSVSKAAQLLHLVQPAVTRQIRSLESELGVALFTRTRTGMAPTDEGEVLIGHARRALHELERARAELTPATDDLTGIVTLGVLESLLEVVVMPVVESIQQRYPQVELRVLTAYSGHMQAWVDAGDVDVALLYNLADSPSIATRPLVEEHLWVVAPAAAGLDPDRPVAWERVWQERLVLPVPGHGLRTLVDRARAETAADPRTSIEVNSLRLQKLMVHSGFGWTVLPAAAVIGDVARGELSGAPLAEPEIARSVVLGFPRSARVSRPVEAVAREVARTVRHLVRSGGWPAARLSGPEEE